MSSLPESRRSHLRNDKTGCGAPAPAERSMGMAAADVSTTVGYSSDRWMMDRVPWALWSCAAGLAAALHFPGHGIDGATLALVYLAFDESLRARNASWGVRDIEAVGAAGEACGLHLVERVAMPANNLSLIFRKAGPTSAAVGKSAT